LDAIKPVLDAELKRVTGKAAGKAPAGKK